MMNNYDLIVIGSGPGGYVAAIRAAQLGLKVAIIERDKLGGICLNWGCIPTKALLKASELNYSLSKIEDFGIKINKPKYDWPKIISRTRKIASKLSLGVEHLLKKNKVEIIYGIGRIAGTGRVTVTKGKSNILYEAPNILIATGASAKYLPGIDSNSKNVWSYKEAMIPDEKPHKILIIGAGAIGVEFACFYNDFGSEVTLIELQKNILPSEDYEISTLAKKYFEKSGIKIHVNTKLVELKSNSKGVNCLFEHNSSKKKYNFDKVILAVGIEANIDDIGLEHLNIQMKEGRILTDNYGVTSEQGIYAIGDVTGSPWLAHKASHEGIRCVEHICNPELSIKHKIIIPSCTFSRPQVASIGLTENEAKVEGYKVKIGKFPLSGNGKSIAMGFSDGLIKTIFNAANGELIGAHMIGQEVTELISNYSIAMQLEATEEELFNIIFPHPTISESIHESVLNAFNRSLHI